MVLVELLPYLCMAQTEGGISANDFVVSLQKISRVVLACVFILLMAAAPYEIGKAIYLASTERHDAGGKGAMEHFLCGMFLLGLPILTGLFLGGMKYGAFGELGKRLYSLLATWLGLPG